MLLTGRYPFRTGWHTHHDPAIYGDGYFDWNREVCLARVMKSAGRRPRRVGTARQWFKLYSTGPFYDLSEDPLEKYNLIGSPAFERPLAREAHDRLQRVLDTLPAKHKTPLGVSQYLGTKDLNKTGTVGLWKRILRKYDGCGRSGRG